MNQEKIKELRKLCEEATPGPWLQKDMPEGYFTCIGPDFSKPHIAKVRNYVHPHGFITDGNSHADADFISAARTALPMLLDEVERLQKISKAAQAIAARLKACDEGYIDTHLEADLHEALGDKND